jgi:hypothetical protein
MNKTKKILIVCGVTPRMGYLSKAPFFIVFG